MLGYFGKNGVVPAPAGVPAATAQVELVGQPTSTAPPPPQEVAQEPQVQPASAPAEQDEVSMRLAQLRATIEAQRASREAEVRKVQEMQRQQAAYGRDTEQLRPQSAGYATEAEKLMGGQTGYARPISGLGSITSQVTSATEDLNKLTAVVKQLTKDVEAGVVPRSELVKAVQELQQKSTEAKKLSKELSGWVDTSTTTKLLVGTAAIATTFLIVKYCF